MIDATLDAFLPTSQQPAPRIETAGDRGVLADRGLAAAIDLVVCVVFVEAPAVYLFGELFSPTYEALGPVVAGVSLLALVPIYASYAFFMEWRYGRTPGKVNRGLLVVMADGSECTYRASVVRNLFRYVDLLGVPPLVVGSVVALATDGSRLGDLAAGTVVVRTTVPGE